MKYNDFLGWSVGGSMELVHRGGQTADRADCADRADRADCAD